MNNTVQDAVATSNAYIFRNRPIQFGGNGKDARVSINKVNIIQN